MVLTDSRIKFFAEQVGLGASELKNKLQELDRQFQECLRLLLAEYQHSCFQPKKTRGGIKRSVSRLNYRTR